MCTHQRYLFIDGIKMLSAPVEYIFPWVRVDSILTKLSNIQETLSKDLLLSSVSAAHYSNDGSIFIKCWYIETRDTDRKHIFYQFYNKRKYPLSFPSIPGMKTSQYVQVSRQTNVHKLEQPQECAQLNLNELRSDDSHAHQFVNARCAMCVCWIAHRLIIIVSRPVCLRASEREPCAIWRCK